MVKKIIAVCLAAVMLFGMEITAAASEYTQKAAENPFSERMSELSAVVTGEAALEEGIQPKWWPGDGPAPQVTRMEISDIGTLNSNGNLCIVVKVYGYGSDVTTFDGKKISWIANKPFIISGTGADGFFYLFDCGVKPAAGHHVFNCRFTSTNFPHSQLTLNYPFDLTL